MRTEWLKRNRITAVSAGTLVVFTALALAAPLISLGYGQDPYTPHTHLLDGDGVPLGYAGGVSGTHWLGIEPQVGRDLFMLVLYGLRTSLFIAVTAAIATTAIGVVVGLIAGYRGGVVDTVLSWVIDFVLAFPFLIFTLAAIPVLINASYGARDAVPTWFRIAVIIGVFTAFSWTYTARLIRGQVLSLREREFVDAARVAGAGTWHIIFREIAPNLLAPITVAFSLAIPAFITAEAALSFLNIGVVEPTPDLGRLIYHSAKWIDADPSYTLIPGGVLFALVLAFNLCGDALRDARDQRGNLKGVR